jgi:hypothetical protein
VIIVSNSKAQIPDRKNEELKAESQFRADHGGASEEAKRALSLIKTGDRDKLAQGLGNVAEKYINQAKPP